VGEPIRVSPGRSNAEVAALLEASVQALADAAGR
jgi:hypothetical protein